MYSVRLLNVTGEASDSTFTTLRCFGCNRSWFLGEFWGGKVTSEFLYMSIFLAFAYLNPNYELLLFFIIPVKVKYLAWFDVVFTVLSIISGRRQESPLYCLSQVL